jgi:hypothetical protein
LIGQINPPSSKGHKFVLLATDYFTKWVESIPLKKVTSKNMVEFVKEHIIYRFGIPQTITTNQGTQFTSSEFRDFAESMGIKLLIASRGGGSIGAWVYKCTPNIFDKKISLYAYTCLYTK